MGKPKHYSLELPQRCMKLIGELLPCVDQIPDPERPDLGPLDTTFVLSMSIPILNLPIERIEKHRSSKDHAFANDRHISSKLTKRIDKAIGGNNLCNSPFFEKHFWRYTFRELEQPFNLAEGIPEDVLTALNEPMACAAAANLKAQQWSSILRNALAHGGIAFLDADGRTSYDRRVDMLLFVSEKWRCKDFLGWNFLRIRQSDYLEFLRLWVNWLQESGYEELAA